MPEHLLAFFVFAVVGSITPGPNNMMSTALGAAYGFRGALPQILGVSVGFPAMFVLLGLGLGELFRVTPWLHETLRYAGAAFLLYLVWRIARSAAPEGTQAGRPITFFEAALFQWLNPKAWTMAVGALAAFTSPGLPMARFLSETAIFAAAFGITAFVSLAIWCLFGIAIAKALTDASKRRAFQLAIAGLLALSVVFLFV